MKIVINRDGKCIQIKKTLRVRSVPIKRKAHILPKKPIIFNKRLLHRSINRYVNLKRRIYFEKTYKGDASLNNYTIDTGVGVIKSLDTQSLSVVVGRIISRKPNYTRIPQTRETFKVARRIEESLRRFVKDAFTEALLGIITNRLMLLWKLKGTEKERLLVRSLFFEHVWCKRNKHFHPRKTLLLFHLSQIMEKHKKLKWDYYFRIEPFGSFFRKRFIIATSSRRLKLYTLKSILKSTKIDRCKTANNFIHSGTRKIYGLVKVVDKRKQI